MARPSTANRCKPKCMATFCIGKSVVNSATGRSGATRPMSFVFISFTLSAVIHSPSPSDPPHPSSSSLSSSSSSSSSESGPPKTATLAFDFLPWALSSSSSNFFFFSFAFINFFLAFTRLAWTTLSVTSASATLDLSRVVCASMCRRSSSSSVSFCSWASSPPRLLANWTATARPPSPSPSLLLSPSSSLPSSNVCLDPSQPAICLRMRVFFFFDKLASLSAAL
mmetsp:Transcript_57140/g.102104  ORF Transcript_57140/g.102104 Transcript_57140/m.102104 type:complete len:224 (-) Transcript_57140:1596-2267(-)